MRFFFSLSPGRRTHSIFSELPVFDVLEDEVQRDYRLLAGGLALLISRCSERAARRDFPASLQAWHILKARMKSGAPAALSAQLLMDLSHEIAELADGATRHAARRCLGRHVRGAIASTVPTGEASQLTPLRTAPACRT